MTPFYMKTLTNTQDGAECWLYQKISNNNIKIMMHDIAGVDCSKRIIVNKSDMSMRTTKLFQEKFTEKAVMSRTDHRSNAVCRYQKENRP